MNWPNHPSKKKIEDTPKFSHFSSPPASTLMKTRFLTHSFLTQFFVPETQQVAYRHAIPRRKRIKSHYKTTCFRVFMCTRLKMRKSPSMNEIFRGETGRLEEGESRGNFLEGSNSAFKPMRNSVSGDRCKKTFSERKKTLFVSEKLSVGAAAGVGGEGGKTKHRPIIIHSEQHGY